MLLKRQYSFFFLVKQQLSLKVKEIVRVQSNLDLTFFDLTNIFSVPTKRVLKCYDLTNNNRWKKSVIPRSSLNTSKKYFVSHEVDDAVFTKLENIDKEFWKVETKPQKQNTVKDFCRKCQQVCMCYGLNFKSK